MKPRRDITLGEMQDECKFRGCDCSTLGGGMCDYFDVCESMHNKKDNFQSPCDWGLTDPPRFNEAQMAFWKMWFDIGAMIAIVGTHDELMAIYFYKSNPATWRSYMGFSVRMDGLGEMELKNGQRINLAELFGKDAI